MPWPDTQILMLSVRGSYGARPECFRMSDGVVLWYDEFGCVVVCCSVSFLLSGSILNIDSDKTSDYYSVWKKSDNLIIIIEILNHVQWKVQNSYIPIPTAVYFRSKSSYATLASET